MNDTRNEEFELVEFLGKPALFSNFRIQRETVPEGLHRYEIRHSDDGGEPCQIGYGILVNHYGTIITNEPIQLDPSGYLDLDDDALNFADAVSYTIMEYKEKYPPIEKAAFEVVAIKPDEVGSLYSDESKDAERGMIGHLRGDFGGGNEFWTTWWPHQKDVLNTSPFKSELNAVVDWLRQDYGPLKNLDSMRGFCGLRNSEAKLNTDDLVYGFKIETPAYQYFLRCTPRKGDYNFYIYCADKEAQRQYQKEKAAMKKPSVVEKIKNTSIKDEKKTAPKKSAEREL